MYKFNEIVLTYKSTQLDDWKKGDKSLIPAVIEIPDDVLNQQSYHFGEYFVLNYYMGKGWKGFVDYAIGDWEPNNKKYDNGRKVLEELFSYARLSKIKSIRAGLLSGEPDVFLYKETGETLFLEVKKEQDKIFSEQLVCLAQIKAILKADVGVVYLKEESKTYTPNIYELDLDEHSGRVI